MTLVVEQASLQDEHIVRQLQTEAVSWLASVGTDQWQPEAMTSRLQHRSDDRGLVPALNRGEVFLLRDDLDVIATLTIDDYADPEFWTPDDDPASALYVHRMIGNRAAAERDIGGTMLDWAETQAEQRHRQWLRLDAWRTNHRLRAYYLQHGFELVRTVELAHRGAQARSSSGRSETPDGQLSRDCPARPRYTVCRTLPLSPLSCCHGMTVRTGHFVASASGIGMLWAEPGTGREGACDGYRAVRLSV